MKSKEFDKELAKQIEQIFGGEAPSYNFAELRRVYDDALDYLDDHYAFFLTHVLKMGRPEWDTSLPTAAVSVNDWKDDPDSFRFLFNPDFMMKLQNPEFRAFIMAHETMHILLNHLSLVRNFIDVKRYSEINKKRRDRKPLTKEEATFGWSTDFKAKVFNVAADCVINDYLVNAGLKGIPGIMYGEDNVGYNCANCTVTEVYEDLMQKIKDEREQCGTCGGTGQKPQAGQNQQNQQNQQGQDDSDKGDQDGSDGSGSDSKEQGDDQNGSGQGAGDQHGNGQGEPCPDCAGTGIDPTSGSGVGQGHAIDSHDWIYESSDEAADQADQTYEDMKDQVPGDVDDIRADNPGGDPSKHQSFNAPAGTELGNFQKFIKDNGATFAWIELLKEIDPDLFKGKGDGPKPRPSYRVPRRKTAYMHPEVILPIYEAGNRPGGKADKPAIVMALDTSGSISERDRNRFISLAQSIPTEKVHLFAVTFTTGVTELDLENPKYRSGGTDFGCIQQYIVNKVKPELDGRYPKAVVVITDGEANFGQTPSTRPSEQEGHSWYWLLTDYASAYYSEYKKYGKSKKLAEFTSK